MEAHIQQRALRLHTVLGRAATASPASNSAALRRSGIMESEKAGDETLDRIPRTRPVSHQACEWLRTMTVLKMLLYMSYIGLPQFPTSAGLDWIAIDYPGHCGSTLRSSISCSHRRFDIKAYT